MPLAFQHRLRTCSCSQATVFKAPRHGPNPSGSINSHKDFDLLPTFRSASVEGAQRQPLQMSSVPLTSVITSRLTDGRPDAPEILDWEGGRSAGTSLPGIHADTVLLATRNTER
jgi:hypothetical protein